MLIAGNKKDFADLYHKLCKSSPDKLKERLLSASLDEWVDFLKKMKINPTKDAAAKRAEYTEIIVGLVKNKKFGIDTYNDWKDAFGSKKVTEPPTPSLVIKIKDIVQKPPFKNLHIIQTSLLKTIISRMDKHGYDRRWPVIIGRGDWTKGKMILLDGHTRVKAAEEVGIAEIPYAIFECESEEEALSYALSSQSVRRNYTDVDVLHLVDFLWERRIQSNDGTYAKANQATQLAEILNVSARRVERARTVILSKNKKILSDIRAGKKKLYEAEKALKKKKDGTRSNQTTPSKRGKEKGEGKENGDKPKDTDEIGIDAGKDEVDDGKDLDVGQGNEPTEDKGPPQKPPKNKIASVWEILQNAWDIYLDWDEIKTYDEGDCTDPSCKFKTHMQILLQNVSSCKSKLKDVIEDLEAEGRIK